jgi:hypothetical protein
MNDNYDDIINLPRPASKNHPPMPMINRAAQFAPFSALSGHDEAINETARWTDFHCELDDSANNILNKKLGYALAHLDENPVITITFFQPDKRKNGGYYIPITGVIKKLDEYEQCIIMSDGIKIPISTISSISGNLFDDLNI